MSLPPIDTLTHPIREGPLGLPRTARRVSRRRNARKEPLADAPGLPERRPPPAPDVVVSRRAYWMFVIVNIVYAIVLAAVAAPGYLPLR